MLHGDERVTEPIPIDVTEIGNDWRSQKFFHLAPVPFQRRRVAADCARFCSPEQDFRRHQINQGPAHKRTSLPSAKQLIKGDGGEKFD